MMNKPLKSKKHDHYLSMYRSNTKRPLQDYSVFTSTHLSPKSSQKDLSSSSPCGSASASTSTSEPRSLKTLNPTCILNKHIIQNIEKNSIKKIDFSDNNNTNHNSGVDIAINNGTGSTKDGFHNFHARLTDSFLNDVQHKPANDFYNPDLLIPNPIHYQEYLYMNENGYDQHLYKPEDSLYTSGFQNDTFDSTSFELDSNVSPQSVSNENINPIFFHNTPSPSDSNSIRIVTASNRIIKLKDKKLLQAIQKSLNSNVRMEALNPNRGNIVNPNDKCCDRYNKSSVGFKKLNDNQAATNSILSSPRKEINESLNNAILQASNFPVKSKFLNPSINQNSINNVTSNEVSNGNVYRGWQNSMNEHYAVKPNEPLSFRSNFDPETNSNPDSERECSSSNATHSNSTGNGNSNSISNSNSNNNSTDLASKKITHSNNINIDSKTYLLPQAEGQQDEKIHKAQHSKQILSIKREIKWKNDFQIPKLRSRQGDSTVSNSKNLNLEMVKENAHNGGYDVEDYGDGRDEDFDDDKLDGQPKNKDVVMEIFRESMRKNKDNFLKTKPRDKSNTPIPKITKLKVTRCIPKLGDPTLRASMYEEKDIFRCAQCPKVFKQRSQWKRHVDCIHLKIAKFVCIKCGKAFKRSDHLKNHIRRIHGT